MHTLSLKIHANLKGTIKNKKENYIRRERSYGQMSRSFYVGDVKKEDVDAHLEKGVLQISVPKKNEKPTNNRIEIR